MQHANAMQEKGWPIFCRKQHLCQIAKPWKCALV